MKAGITFFESEFSSEQDSI